MEENLEEFLKKVNKSSFITAPFIIKVEKPWGYELILTPPETSAVGKLLHINAGARLSLQYHEIKEETLILIDGQAKLIYGTDQNSLTEEKMKSYHGYFITNGLIHRIRAITDCDILESSTSEVGKTVRLSDDYSRGDETEEERLIKRKS